MSSESNEKGGAEEIPIKKCKTDPSTPTKADSNGGGKWTTVPESPPKYVTFEQLMSATNGVKNMTLAHEIAVDNNFMIASPSEKASGLEKKVRDVVHQVFWDSLQESLDNDPPDYSPALSLLKELRAELLSLTLPQHTRLRSQIEEVFDMDLIEQQIEHKILNVRKFTKYVVDTLSKLCAPVRDEAVEKLRHEDHIVPLFKGIFELMESMKMDMANFTIAQIRPYLQQQSVDYERIKFNEFLGKQKEAGVDGLLLTRLWLQSANRHISTNKAMQVTPAAVINQAYLMLLTSAALYEELDDFPETLLMDLQRFCELHQQTWKLTLVAAMLLVTYNTAGSPIAGISGLKDKLKSQIIIILENSTTKDQVSAKAANISDQLIKEVDAVLQQHGFATLTSTQKNLVTAQISEVISEDHSVHKLIRGRLMDFILEMMTRDQKGPLKIPSGLSVVEADLSLVCGQFLRLVSHNRSVFSQHYAEIIEKITQRAGVENGV